MEPFHYASCIYHWRNLGWDLNEQSRTKNILHPLYFLQAERARHFLSSTFYAAFQPAFQFSQLSGSLVYHLLRLPSRIRTSHLHKHNLWTGYLLKIYMQKPQGDAECQLEMGASAGAAPFPMGSPLGSFTAE